MSTGARAPVRYSLRPSTKGQLRFTLTSARQRELRRSVRTTLTDTATNTDAAGGVVATRGFEVVRPLPPLRRKRR